MSTAYYLVEIDARICYNAWDSNWGGNAEDLYAFLQYCRSITLGRPDLVTMTPCGIDALEETLGVSFKQWTPGGIRMFGGAQLPAQSDEASQTGGRDR